MFKIEESHVFVYVVLDKMANEFLEPFFAKSDELARRVFFGSMMRNPFVKDMYLKRIAIYNTVYLSFSSITDGPFDVDVEDLKNEIYRSIINPAHVPAYKISNKESLKNEVY